jgi:hypothetical protein
LLDFCQKPVTNRAFKLGLTARDLIERGHRPDQPPTSVTATCPRCERLSEFRAIPETSEIRRMRWAEAARGNSSRNGSALMGSCPRERRALAGRSRRTDVPSLMERKRDAQAVASGCLQTGVNLPDLVLAEPGDPVGPA